MTFFVDFGGWCEIEAESEEQARKKFWQLINEDKPLPSNVYEIHGTELKDGV